MICMISKEITIELLEIFHVAQIAGRTLLNPADRTSFILKIDFIESLLIYFSTAIQAGT
jgi:hypothetical protein